MACSRATSAAGEPSTPTTIRPTRVRCAASCVASSISGAWPYRRRQGQAPEIEDATQDAAHRTRVGRIVVGVDGSPAAEVALEHAIREAEAWGAELTAVAGVPIGTGTSYLAWLPAAVDHETV